MMLNILIVLVMFIPFYVSLVYKHCTLLTKVMVFLWCTACSSMMILCVSVSLILQLLSYPHEIAIIGSVIAWGVVGMYIALKAVFSDSPGTKIPK